MLRPPTPQCLDRLLAAHEWTDRDLDCALSDVGVLPPAELADVRSVLAARGATLATRRNVDGHAIIEVRLNDAPYALIHQDGFVEHLLAVAA